MLYSDVVCVSHLAYQDLAFAIEDGETAETHESGERCEGAGASDEGPYKKSDRDKHSQDFEGTY